ncbi:MAG TPA: GNAT family N-acetyltransferase [Candidatus Limnocylindria bacterium]|jgi:RimJ/RimL family protein N-acetyltransferase|nr:GNAT family N-acetyltransferase [Candidatus Limnocylindria bacterium]
MNGFDQAPVTIRPMHSQDVQALAGWERHADPAFRSYDVGPLSADQAERLWQALSSPPGRRPYVAALGERVVGHLLLREVDPESGTAELGIMLDPSVIGRGLGRRILRQFAGYCAGCGLRRLTLEVVATNERAQRAYRAAGFVTCGERWGEPAPGQPPVRILRMETELRPETFLQSEL